MKQIGFFDEKTAYERLSQLGDKLEWLDSIMDWKIFLPLLEEAKPDKTQTSSGGRPPLPLLMMFKILLLQEYYGVANDATEFLINDRLSWKRFLGLSLSDKAPDGSTIWLFREQLMNTGVYDDLFLLFNKKMEQLGIITHKGNIMDASFVDVPRQRNSRDENKAIKEGSIPEGWDAPEKAPMLEQKDLDATWAKKNDEVHYGYKDHITCDSESKLITNYTVTAAHVHDSKVAMELLLLNGEKMGSLWADSAYMSKGFLKQVELNYPQLRLFINEKGSRGNPLTDMQKNSNREKSKIRARIEHVFGHISSSMAGMTIRSIGIRRAECTIALRNLAYNISRYATLRKLIGTPRML